jgi:hypothetical protein
LSAKSTKTVTPQQAIDNLTAQIVSLKKLKAQIPLLVLGPAMDEAILNIQKIAAELTLPSAIELRPPGLVPPGTTIEIPTAPTPAPAEPPTTPPAHQLVVGDPVIINTNGHKGKISFIAANGNTLVNLDAGGHENALLTDLTWNPPPGTWV